MLLDRHYKVCILFVIVELSSYAARFIVFRSIFVFLVMLTLSATMYDVFTEKENTKKLKGKYRNEFREEMASKSSDICCSFLLYHPKYYLVFLVVLVDKVCSGKLHPLPCLVSRAMSVRTLGILIRNVGGKIAR